MSSFIRLSPRGPFERGSCWDEKGRRKIARIFITFGDTSISSLQTQYVDNGYLMLSDVRGNNARPRVAPNFSMVALNQQREYMTGLSGIYDFDAVISLTFETNLNKYGPYGWVDRCDRSVDHKTRFTLQFGPGNNFGGFHGYSSSEELKAIGVYVIA